ncbi:hypothetical protein J1614_000004, partial [Plenodomus biglobosus]
LLTLRNCDICLAPSTDDNIGELQSLAVTARMSASRKMPSVYVLGKSAKPERIRAFLVWIISFLARLPSNALGWICRLTILLPPIDNTSLSGGQMDWTSWHASIQVLATGAIPPSPVFTVKIGIINVRPSVLLEKKILLHGMNSRYYNHTKKEIRLPVQVQGLK